MFSYMNNTVVTSHIGSESDVLSKANWKSYSKTQIDEKSLPFHVLDNFFFLFFFLPHQAAFALHNIDIIVVN